MTTPTRFYPRPMPTTFWPPWMSVAFEAFCGLSFVGFLLCCLAVRCLACDLNWQQLTLGGWVKHRHYKKATMELY
ncbi:hypothetical protein L596_020062 [Steinernema carpocapsae]|nr:hypothetical protein L596_020062 [Steinernema carpocapsae]